MNSNNTYLNDLINVGRDAFSNLFDVVVEDPELVNDELSDKLRTHIIDFTPPHFSLDMGNKIHYKTVSMSAPTPTIVGKKELKLQYRLDGAYEIYAYWLRARNRQSTPNLGKATSAVNDKLSVKFSALADSITSDSLDPTSDTGYKKLGEYRYCWVKDITIDAYSYDANRPMKITVTLGFQNFDEMK